VHPDIAFDSDEGVISKGRALLSADDSEFDASDFADAKNEISIAERGGSTTLAPTGRPTTKKGLWGADDDTVKRAAEENSKWTAKYQPPTPVPTLVPSAPSAAPTSLPTESKAEKYKEDKRTMEDTMDAVVRGGPTPSPKQMIADLAALAADGPSKYKAMMKYASPTTLPTISPTYSFDVLSKCALKQAAAENTLFAAKPDPDCPKRALCFLHKELPSCRKKISFEILPDESTDEMATVLKRAFERQTIVRRAFRDQTKYYMMRRGKGTMLGQAPWIKPSVADWRNPRNIQPSEEACKTQCTSLKKCFFSTYITGGDRKGECWLAKRHHEGSVRQKPCGVPCTSFIKVAMHGR
jgi:hypothetical protein